jgi:hypothetical protein
MPKDLTFQAIKLLSQYIVGDKDKIPEGPLFQKTSCMDPQDAEIVGILDAAGSLIEDQDQETAQALRKYIPFFEKLGIAKWSGKGELTHLGFRAGVRYEEYEKIDPNQIQTIDEAEINASSSTETPHSQ